MDSSPNPQTVEKHAAQPLVSVILPTYNRERFLAESIRSVLGQTYRNFDLIVVDDGSTDRTEELVRSFQEEPMTDRQPPATDDQSPMAYGQSAALLGWPLGFRPSPSPAVHYVRQPHSGVAAARNRGLAASRGELIAFQDSDDLWHPEKLALQVALLGRRPEVGVVCTAEQIIDAHGNVVGGQWKRLHSGCVTEHLFQSIFVTMPSAVVRRNVVDRVGRFDTRLRINSDYQFWLRASLATEFYALERPLVYERRSPNRLTSAKVEAATLQYQMLVQFYEELGGKTRIRPRIATRVLARAAFRAGRALKRERRFTEARQMFARSLGHRFTLRAGWACLRTCRARPRGNMKASSCPDCPDCQPKDTHKHPSAAVPPGFPHQRPLY